MNTNATPVGNDALVREGLVKPVTGETMPEGAEVAIAGPTSTRAPRQFKDADGNVIEMTPEELEEFEDGEAMEADAGRLVDRLLAENSYDAG